MPGLAADILAEIAARCTAVVIKTAIDNRDVLEPFVADMVRAAGAGWRAAFTDTIEDAKPLPEEDAVRAKLQADIAAGRVPGAD